MPTHGSASPDSEPPPSSHDSRDAQRATPPAHRYRGTRCVTRLTVLCPLGQEPHIAPGPAIQVRALTPTRCAQTGTRTQHTLRACAPSLEAVTAAVTGRRDLGVPLPWRALALARRAPCRGVPEEPPPPGGSSCATSAMRLHAPLGAGHSCSHSRSFTHIVHHPGFIQARCP